MKTRLVFTVRLVFTRVVLLPCCSAVLLDFFSGFVAPAGAQSGSPKSWLTWGGGVNYRPGDYLTVRQPDELSDNCPATLCQSCLFQALFGFSHTDRCGTHRRPCSSESLGVSALQAPQKTPFIN